MKIEYMVKRFFLYNLLITTVLSAFSQEKVTIDNLTYSVADGSATLVSGLISEEATDIVIPEQIPVGGKRVDVTRIDRDAFYNTWSCPITSVDIPKTVVEIGNCAFFDCTRLKTVILRGCPVIDRGVFYCYATPVPLDRIVCYSSVPPKCGSDCFSCFTTRQGLPRKVELQVPQGYADAYSNSIAWCRFDVTEIEAEPFVSEPYDEVDTGLYFDRIWYELSKSEDLAEAKVIPFHTPIMQERYQSYYTKNELDIPEEVILGGKLVFKVTEIADGAFDSDDYFPENRFQVVKVPSSVRRIGSHAFNKCSYLTTVNFSEGLKEIGGSAFSKCSNLEELILPASIEQIGTNVLYGCSRLKTVYCYAVVPPSCTENSFKFEENMETVVFYVPKGCREAYESSPGWNSVTIREMDDNTGITSPELQEDSQSRCYDLLGRRLLSLPQKGVYIQCGKKKL